MNSPLHAAIVAGGMSGITRGDSQTVTLNPAKYSFDPDLPEGIEQVRWITENKFNHILDYANYHACYLYHPNWLTDWLSIY